MSSFSLYVIGYAVLLAGLAYGAHLLNAPRAWIAAADRLEAPAR